MPQLDDKRYIPALGYQRLTGLYDPVLRWLMREGSFKNRLVEEAGIQPDDRVLDLGCGTATLTLLIKRRCPQAEVEGIDGDPKVLEIARRKIAAAGLDVKLVVAMAYRLPYPDATFDHVVSSLLFHHLTHQDKHRTLLEVRRVLKPHGRLHTADFGPSHNALMWLVSLVMRHFEEYSDNLGGALPRLVTTAGFPLVTETGCFTTIFGSVHLYRAAEANGGETYDQAVGEKTIS